MQAKGFLSFTPATFLWGDSDHKPPKALATSDSPKVPVLPKGEDFILALSPGYSLLSSGLGGFPNNRNLLHQGDERRFPTQRTASVWTFSSQEGSFLLLSLRAIFQTLRSAARWRAYRREKMHGKSWDRSSISLAVTCSLGQAGDRSSGRAFSPVCTRIAGKPQALHPLGVSSGGKAEGSPLQTARQ